MIYYFIDRQSCDADCKSLIENSIEDTRVYIFYTKHQLTKLEEKGYLFELRDHLDKITFIKCASSKQLYYMEIVAHVTKICGDNKEDKFYIVSTAKDILKFVSYWQTTFGINIHRKKVVPLANVERREIINELKRKELTKDESFYIYVLANEVKDDLGTLRDVYIEMTKRFGKEKGLSTFNATKDVVLKIMEGCN